MRPRNVAIVAQLIVCLLVAPVGSEAASPLTVAHYQRLGDWNHIDVVYRPHTDETITFGSDDTWAQQVRETLVSSGNFLLRCFDPNYSGDPTLDCNDDPAQGPVSRPGAIACAFIQRYTGEWQVMDPNNIGTGQSMIAVRDDNSTSATSADCTSLYDWTAAQNARNGFVAGGSTGGRASVEPPAHKAQRPPTFQKVTNSAASCTDEACAEASTLRLLVAAPGHPHTLVDSGSCFVITSDRSATYLLTNRHVLDPGMSSGTLITVYVATRDGTIRYVSHAVALGSGPDGSPDDLAVVEIPASTLRPLAWGNSDTLHDTQVVISMGYPLDLPKLSVTNGTLSGRDYDGWRMVDETEPRKPNAGLQTLRP